MALLHERHQHAASARAWFDTVELPGELGLTRNTRLATLRLLNNPAVMGRDVLTGAEAWEAVDGLLEDFRVVVLEEPASIETHLRALTSKVKYSPNAWADAYLAAFAMGSGLTMVSFDRGFRAWPGLKLHLLEGAPRRH